jgi:hypothetical protein
MSRRLLIIAVAAAFIPIHAQAALMTILAVAAAGFIDADEALKAGHRRRHLELHLRSTDSAS